MNTPMTNPQDIHRFALAGRAVLSLKSKVTGKHYTYKIGKTGKKNHGPPCWFVRALIGPNNDDPNAYLYLGYIKSPARPQLRMSAKSCFVEEDPCAKAFSYFADHVLAAGELPPKLEVWHDCRCGRCGRELTDPASIARGIGPECAVKMGIVE